MRADVVVPETKECKILLRFRGRVEGPLADKFLEGLEEPLHAPVLPGREGRDALMPDTEQAKSEMEELRREDGFIVGTDVSGLAEALDCIEDRAKDRD